MYLGSNISSTENDFNIRVEKAWTAIDESSTVRKFNLYSNKTGILSCYSHVSIIVWLHHLDFNETPREEACWGLCCLIFWTNPGSSTPQNSTSTAICLPSNNQIRWVRHAEYCWAGGSNGLISEVIRWSSSYPYTNVGWTEKSARGGMVIVVGTDTEIRVQFLD